MKGPSLIRAGTDAVNTNRRALIQFVRASDDDLDLIRDEWRAPDLALDNPYG